MNTNLLNQSPNITETFIKSIPCQEFYSNILTRPKIAHIYDKYYLPNQSKYQLTPEQVLRAIIVTCFRYINMSIQDVSLLLVYGLDNLNRLDLDLTDKHLAAKLAQQNPDKNDIDVINRIVAQIVTKLPADLRDKLNPLLRIRIIQKLNSDLSHMYDFIEKKNIESIKQNPNPSDTAKPAGIKGFSEGFQNNRLLANNTPSTTSLTNNFLKEVQDIKNSLGAQTVKELTDSGYSIQDITKSSIDMRFDAGDYESQLKSINLMPANNKITTDTIPENVIKGGYVQKDPQLHMDAKTKELYYFDEYSGSLIPISDVQKIKGEDVTTEKQLDNLLKGYNLTKQEIDAILSNLKNKPLRQQKHTVATDNKNVTGNYMNYIIYGIVTITTLIVVLTIFTKLRRK